MKLIKKLSLDGFVRKMMEYFAREGSGGMKAGLQGEEMDSSVYSIEESKIHVHDKRKLKELITCIESIPRRKLPKVRNLDRDIYTLKVGGKLRVGDVFEFLKIVNTFTELKNMNGIASQFLEEYLNNIKVPQELESICKEFDEKGDIKPGVSETLDRLNGLLEEKIQKKKDAMDAHLNDYRLHEYLVDKSMHLVNERLSILVRPGFSAVLSARIIERSGGGFFFVVPDSISSLENEIHTLQDKVREEIWRLEAKYSAVMRSQLPFIRFINKEFDALDGAIARVNFASDYDLEFVFASEEKSFVLRNFRHPNVEKCVPLNIDLDKRMIIVTGVNAGGKTMLMKSILGAAWLAKHYIPFKVDARVTKIPYVQGIHAIIQDPQDSKNDISTFSGRIKEFKEILGMNDMLVGIDEIEIGTDANEAAALYKVLLDELLKLRARVIVTTHHKSLAALMADDPEVGMLAATYDHKSRKPRFEFIEGIGKSYALLVARDCGIPEHMLKKAQDLLGKEANRLESLIEKHTIQITSNKRKEQELETKIRESNEKIEELKQLEISLRRSFEAKYTELQREYNKSIKELRMLIKDSEQETRAKGHQLLNKVHSQQKPRLEITPVVKEKIEVHDSVMYNSITGEVIEIKNGAATIVLSNGLKVAKVSIESLTKVAKTKKNKSDREGIKLEAEIRAKREIRLHGMREEEAMEELEDFLQNAIMAKFNDVIVVHGNGRLKKVTEDFLSSSGMVQRFTKAPPRMGGEGAKIVYL